MRLCFFMSAVVLAAAGAAQGQSRDLNVISKVEVRDAGSSVVVSIHGSKPPNFTTFSMMDPPRFVIDFSESRFRDVPEDMPVGDGLIRVIKNLSYGSDTNSIARVMIAFEGEVDPPDVQATGETLLVKVAKPPGLSVASAAPAGEAAAQRKAEEEAAAAAAAKARREQEAKAGAAAKAKDEEEARAAREAQARTAEEARIKAEAEAQARADAAADAKAKAEAEAQARAEHAAKAEAKAEADAKAQAEAQAKAAEEARIKAKTEAEAQAQAEGSVSPQAVEPAQETQAPRPATPETESAAAPPEHLVSRGPSQVREVGFKMLPEVSRVFVRTSSLPEFTVQEAGENLIRLELANTRVKRKNDTRFLDTSFFPSAVAMVTPKRQGSSYVLEIKLKQRVPYQQKVDGDMLAIDFERPASMRSSAPDQPAAQPEATSGEGQAEAADGAPPQGSPGAQVEGEGADSPSPGPAGN